MVARRLRPAPEPRSNLETKFSHSPYDFPGLIDVCEALARDSVERGGGAVERDSEGRETLVIPDVPIRPSPLERSWDPGPVAGSVYTEEELVGIPAAEE